MKIFVLLAVLLILLLAVHLLLMSFGTQFGKTGRRNVFLQNVFCIAEALTVLLLGAGLTVNAEPDDRIYVLGAVAVGIILLICGIVGTRSILKETPDDLTTAELSDVRIVSTGYHNHSKQLEGMSNGTRVQFILRGADKAVAEQIKDNGCDRVMVVYHSSSHRIESIDLGRPPSSHASMREAHSKAKK